MFAQPANIVGPNMSFREKLSCGTRQDHKINIALTIMTKTVTTRSIEETKTVGEHYFVKPKLIAGPEALLYQSPLDV